MLRWIGESRRENFEIFDFDLGQPERDEIDLLPTEVRTANRPVGTGLERMRRHAIAVIPGDGIGREVTPVALEVREAAGRAHGFELRLPSTRGAATTSPRPAP